MSDTFTGEDTARQYTCARALPQETLDMWMATLRGLLSSDRVGIILDLGAGTGRFSAALRAAFACPVIAVEPSEVMLEQGRSLGIEGIEWRLGSAEDIPLETASADLIWMSQVFHHLDRPEMAFKEIRRVLAPGGCFAMRNGTIENIGEGSEWLTCFPESQALSDAVLPSRQGIVDTISSQGFECLAVRTVFQFTVASYAEYYERIRKRAVSTLIHISDEAFEAGLVRMKAWVEHQPPDKPVYEPMDLFIFRAEA